LLRCLTEFGHSRIRLRMGPPYETVFYLRTPA